jgi:acyl-homoserine lactone acylase PvdQ
MFFESQPLLVPGNISIRWAGLNHQDDSLTGIIKIINAHNLKEVEEAVHLVSVPSMNILFATKDNDIGYYAIGKYPKRKRLLDMLFIKNGSDPLQEAMEFYDIKDNPHVVNPKKGYIVSANQALSSIKSTTKIGSTVSITPRSIRITDMIENKLKNGDKLDKIDMRDITLDYTDVCAIGGVKLLLNSINDQKMIKDKGFKSDVITQLNNLLKNWDHKLLINSTTALVYMLWYENFLQELMLDTEISRAALNGIVRSFTFSSYICFAFDNISYTTGMPIYDDVVDRQRKRSVQDAVYAALTNTLSTLGDFTHKIYGDYHKVDFFELPFGQAGSKLLSYIFNEERMEGGNGNTPNAKLSYINAPLSKANGQAGMRFISDYGDGSFYYSLGTVIL